MPALVIDHVGGPTLFEAHRAGKTTVVSGQGMPWSWRTTTRMIIPKALYAFADFTTTKNKKRKCHTEGYRRNPDNPVHVRRVARR